MYVDITDRKKAEDAVGRANQEWEQTFNAISDLVMVLDEQHRILRANRAMAEALGMTEQEIMGRLCFELVHGQEAPPVFCPHSQLLADGGEHSAEVVEPRLGGTYDVRVSPLLDEGGRVVGSVHVTRDITGKKQADQALRESEAKFRNLFNNAEVGMFRTRLDGSEILDMNEKLLKFFGITREELQGKPSVIYWADPHEREAMVRMLEIDGRVADFECKMFNKHGEVRQCITSLRCPEQGVLEGSITDITERKRNESIMLARLRLVEYAASHSLDEAAPGHLGRSGNVDREQDRLLPLPGRGPGDYSASGMVDRNIAGRVHRQRR